MLKVEVLFFFIFFFFEGGGGGLGLGTCSPTEILKMYAPNEAIWGYSRPFHNFFSHLKIQKLLETL